MPGAQGRLKRCVQLCTAGLHTFFKVTRQQFLVFFNYLVQQGPVRRGDRGKVALAVIMSKQLHHVLPMRSGQVQQQTLRPETPANVLHQGTQVDVVGVNLVDDNHAAQTALTGLGEHAFGVEFNAGLRADDDQGCVSASQCAQRLTGKVGVTGGVDQVHMGACGLKTHNGRLQRMAQLFFNRVKVAHRVAFFDRAAAGNGTGGRQQVFCQRGFTDRTVTDQNHAANVFSCVAVHDNTLE